MHVFSRSGKSTGLGHVVRCLSLCLDARKNGVQVYFYTNELVENLKSLFNESCDEVIEVTGVSHYLEDLKKLQSLVDVILIDDYSIYGPDQTEIKKYCKRLVVVADDFYSDYFNCSILVNPNPYKIFNGPKCAKDQIDYVLEGCEYISLKQAIIDAGESRCYRKKQGGNLLFLTGGTDSTSIAELFVENAIFFEKEFDKIEVIGSLDIPSELSDKVSLIQFTDRIHENILNAEIVVTPVGSTVWETFFLNRVVVGFCVSDNQKQVFRYLEENNLILPINIKSEEWINQLSRHILNLRKNRTYRHTLLKKAANLIDGKGARRIIEKMFEGLEE